MSDPQVYFWIVAPVGVAVAINPNGTKTLLSNSVSTFFIDGTPTDINGLRKLENPPSWQVIFLVVPLKRFLFS